MDRTEQIAREVVAEAGEIIRTAFSSPLQAKVHAKGPVDIVTETDQRVESVIVDRLLAAFPDHKIVAEELASRNGTRLPAADAPVWYIDPLDGTVNFAHGLPHFSVSLAYGQGTDIELGIVHDPIRGETFLARRGQGATRNDHPIRVSQVPALTDSLIATGLPYDRRDHAEYYLAFTADFLRRSRDVRRWGSAALDLCYVACGRFDGFWEWKLHPWDTAAGTLILSEAGGRVSDFRGNPFRLFGEQTLASNGRVHAEMVAVLTQRLTRAESLD